MPQKMPTALYREGARHPNHPGGLSSLGMVLADERMPWTPPRNWDLLPQEEKDAWAEKHLTPAEWDKARNNLSHALITLSAYFTFFGMLVSRMAQKQVWIESEKQLADIEGSMTQFRTLATDGRVLYIWPQCALYHTLFELQGLLLHELMHNLLLHPLRGRGMDRGLANVAMDYATNLMVNDASMTSVGIDPTQTALTEAMYDQLPWVIPIGKQSLDVNDPTKVSGYFISEEWRLPNGQVTIFEEIYHKLQQRPPDQQQQAPGGGQGQLVNDHSLWDPANRPADENGEVNGEKMTASKMRDMVADAVVAVGEKNMGSLPSGLRRMIDKWLHPPLPWYQLLSIYMQSAPYDVHWSPGDLRCEEDSPAPWIVEEPTIKYAVFGFDTSGSMSDKEIAACVANAKAILKGWPSMKGLLMFWDASVHNVFELDEWEGIVDREGVGGGGGTRIAPLFEEIKNRGLEQEVAVVVDFTDGYVPWGEVDPDKLPYDVLWVITNETEKPPVHPRYRHTVLDPN